MGQYAPYGEETYGRRSGEDSEQFQNGSLHMGLAENASLKSDTHVLFYKLEFFGAMQSGREIPFCKDIYKAPIAKSTTR